MSRKVNKGKSMKLGGGGRFAKLAGKLGKRKGVYDPKALAASIGRKELGKDRFQSLAAKGRARKSRSGGGTSGEVT